MQSNRPTAPVVTLQGEPWGVAHTRRGKKWHDEAVAFAERFPIGTTLSSTEMGEWAQQRNLLTIPASKHDPEWLGYLQTRGEIRERLRKAGTHPRMQDEISVGSTFTLERIAREEWRVVPTQDAITRSDVMGDVQSYIATKKKHFKYLAQGAGSTADALTRYTARQVYLEIERTERDIRLRQQDMIANIQAHEAWIAQIQQPALPAPTVEPEEPIDLEGSGCEA